MPKNQAAHGAHAGDLSTTGGATVAAEAWRTRRSAAGPLPGAASTTAGTTSTTAGSPALGRSGILPHGGEQRGHYPGCRRGEPNDDGRPRVAARCPHVLVEVAGAQRGDRADYEADHGCDPQQRVADAQVVSLEEPQRGEPRKAGGGAECSPPSGTQRRCSERLIVNGVRTGFITGDAISTIPP
jgi:hypothetical protein